MRGHLIHIGYPKTGSTFLQAWFNQHPKLCFSNGGLGSFNNVFEMARHAARENESTFEYFVTSFEGLSTPINWISELPIEFGLRSFFEIHLFKVSQARVCEYLKCLYPNGKILIVTRGFKGFFLSLYSEYARCGGILDFPKMCKGVLEMDLLDFDYLIRLYEDNFGKENLIVIPYELLRDDQNKFFAVIEERLNLPHFEAGIGRLNESLSSEELYWYPKISAGVSRFAQRFGQSGYAKIYQWYISKTIKNKFQKIIKLLSRWKPDRKVSASDFPDELLNCCKGKATILRDNPLYAPYLSEYLLDE
jgi:hypothetical protein